MFHNLRKGACIAIFAFIIVLTACTPSANASSYIHTSYSDFIQGNGDGNIVFGQDGGITLSKQVGTAVGGFKLVGQLPFTGEPRITAARGCLYATKVRDTCIYRAPIQEDGTIGEWQATEFAHQAQTWGALAVVGDYVYVGARGAIDDKFFGALYAKLGVDGSIAGPWQEYWVSDDDTGGPLRIAHPGPGCAYLFTNLGPSTVDIGPTGGFTRATGGMAGFQSSYLTMNLLDGMMYLSNGMPLANIKYGLLDVNGSPLWVKTAFPLRWGYHPLGVPSTVGVGGCLIGLSGHRDPYLAGFPYTMNGVASMIDSSGDPQARRAISPLPLSLAYAGTAYWNDRIYIAGGGYRPPTDWKTEIYAAKTIEEGVPGQWTETSAMPASVGRHAAVATDSHVYVIGGEAYGGVAPSPGGVWSGVLTAPILGDGTLGAWSQTTSLPEKRSFPGAAVYGDSIYVAGGIGSGGPSTTVYRSRIMSDGALGDWETLTELPEPAHGHALVANGAYLYCVYGSTSYGPWPKESPLYSAPILQDGTLGAWTKVAMMPMGLSWLSALTMKRRLYTIGGEFYGKRVFSAPLTADGGIGEWSQEADLQYAVKAQSAVKYHDDTIYVLGGDTAFDTKYWTSDYPSVYDLPGSNIVFRGTADANGHIGEWEMLGPAPYPNYYATGAALAGDTIYFVGGSQLDQTTMAKAYCSRIHTPDTELPTVSGGRYVGNFRLERDEPMVSLHWTGDFGEGSGAQVRYRLAKQGDATYGPWTEFSSANPLTVGQVASFLQYEVRLTSASGNPAAVDSIRLVTDVTPPAVTVTATPGVLWPANGRLIPVKIGGSATDTESGIDHIEITITDEYDLPWTSLTEFGQTVRLQASRRGDDLDGRDYIIRATAFDRAGNSSKAFALVTCPHDMSSVKKPPRRWVTPPKP